LLMRLGTGFVMTPKTASKEKLTLTNCVL